MFFYTVILKSAATKDLRLLSGFTSRVDLRIDSPISTDHAAGREKPPQIPHFVRDKITLRVKDRCK